MDDITTLAVQKVTKPNIEDVFPCYVDGEALKTALDFITYLRENKMKPSWTLHNAWKCTYKSEVLYYIRLPLWRKEWTFTPYIHNINEYEDKIDNEEMRKRILGSLWYANPNCENKQKRGCECDYHRELFGKQVHLCRGHSMWGYTAWFNSPNETEIEWIKMLLALEKQARANKR